MSRLGRLATLGVRAGFVALAVSTLLVLMPPSARAADWPQWQGPDRNAVSRETGLLQEWPKDGPPLVWKATGLGKGMGGIAVSRARCYTTDGKEVWRVNYVKDLGGIMPVWGFAESPLVDGDKIICTPGAEDATLMALDKQTGKPIWKCKVPEGPTGNRGFLGTSGAAYASVIAIDFEGVRQYVQLTATTLVGVSSDGKLLWRYDRASTTHRINCSTPVYHDGLVFAASSYDAGGGAVKLSKGDKGEVTAKEVYFSNKLKNHHGGFVVVDGYLYGCFDPGILTCIDFKTGKVMWQDRGPGKGSIMYADGRLYCRNEGAQGTVYLVDADPKKYVERGRFDQPDRSKEQAWPHPVLANGKLYIRDQDVLLGYDVKAK